MHAHIMSGCLVNWAVSMLPYMYRSINNVCTVHTGLGPNRFIVCIRYIIYYTDKINTDCAVSLSQEKLY